ncbi:MAG: Tex-like N-terminal domain-containing protein, partial [Planctomycetota bacterium]
MASESTLLRLQAEFDNPPESICAVAELLEAGATPDFLSHYRRDETGDIGEARTFAIAGRLHFLEDLAARKQAILEQAEAKGEVSQQLRQTLEQCFDQDVLDDIYQSFRPKRRTRGVQAAEKGLDVLARQILDEGLGDTTLRAACDALISPEKDLPTREAVLEGILHFIAEECAQEIDLRTKMRQELWSGILSTKAKNTQRRGAQRYKQFFDFAQPVRRIPSGQMLSLRHAEREGIIEVSLDLPDGKAETILREHLGIDDSKDAALRDFLVLLRHHTWTELMRPAGAADVRHKIKERADLETVRALGRNLHSQLMAPPLGRKKALGLRASRKTVWVVILAEDGSLVEHHTLAVEAPEQRTAAVDQLCQIITTQQPAAIALPHGRHQEVTNEFLQEVLQKLGEHDVIIVSVDEAASAIHATSATGRKELPNLEVGIRTAVSLARRLQDPMHELLGLDPKALGLGHVLEEVHQGILSRHLDQAISSCVAKVGMDVNAASASHLSRVPGLSRELARKIVDHRHKAGNFKSLAQLQADLEIPHHDFLQVAGFLRIHGGEEPLDATGVHPESYDLVAGIAASMALSTAEMLGRSTRTVPIDQFTNQETGPIRVRDVLGDVSRFGRDPRGTLTSVRNPGVRTVQDLLPDQELRGRVTNLTDFGAFVDLGIGQDGLVHVSQIPPQRLRDPRRMLAVGEVITTFVLQVDDGRKRISLSMHKPRHLAE